MELRFVEACKLFVADGRCAERDDLKLLGWHAEISETRRRQKSRSATEAVPRQIEHLRRIFLELCRQ